MRQEAAVARRLGIRALRDEQAEAVEAVLAGRDTVLVLPTGGGKSAVYQISGAVLDGPTIVVSPLLALQRDQLATLDEARVGRAAALNAQCSESERAELLERISDGRIDFVLLAPEQLASDEVIEALAAAQPALLVIDEAHCIATWGHHFRPDYLLLGVVAKALGRPPVLALTATAPPHVLDEIIQRLGLHEPEVIHASSYRPNLHLAVQPVDDDPAAAVPGIVGDLAGKGLVYVATRRAAEELARALDRPDRRAFAYHAALSAKRRHEVQDAFTAGDPSVVVATTAFGMGIDVPDVRFVVHVEAPESLEAYYQEIGRAGRDGQHAHAVVVWDRRRTSRRAFAGGVSTVSPRSVTAVLGLIDGGVGDLEGLRSATRRGLGHVVQAVTMLVDAGAVRLDPDGRVQRRPDAPPREQVAASVAEAAGIQRTVQQTRVAMMRAFLEDETCRWRSLLGYLGEPSPEHCGHCDRCDALGAAGEDLPDEELPVIEHEVFGEGTVLRQDGDRLTVLFPTAGYRVLSAHLLEEEDLLR